MKNDPTKCVIKIERPLHRFIPLIDFKQNLIHDLYRFDLESKELIRLTNDERLEEPDISWQANKIVAVHTEENHSDLYLLNFDGSHPVQLTSFNDRNTQVYAPRWSADGGNGPGDTGLHPTCAAGRPVRDGRSRRGARPDRPDRSDRTQR